MQFIDYRLLIEYFNVNQEAIEKSTYTTKGGKIRIRLTNNKPSLALIPALLPYTIRVNAYIRTFANVTSHTTQEKAPDGSTTGNNYRDANLENVEPLEGWPI